MAKTLYGIQVGSATQLDVSGLTMNLTGQNPELAGSSVVGIFPTATFTGKVKLHKDISITCSGNESNAELGEFTAGGLELASDFSSTGALSVLPSLDMEDVEFASVEGADKAAGYAACFAQVVESGTREAVKLVPNADGSKLLWTYVNPVNKAALVHDGTSTEYTKLSKALAAAVDGDTVKMLNVDYLALSTLAVDKAVTLDLNGRNILASGTVTPVVTYTGSGTLKLVDSSGERGVISDMPTADGVTSDKTLVKAGNATVKNTGAGTLDLEGVTVRGAAGCVRNEGAGNAVLRACKLEMVNNYNSECVTVAAGGSRLELDSCELYANPLCSKLDRQNASMTKYAALVSGSDITVKGGSYRFAQGVPFGSGAVFCTDAGNSIRLSGSVKYDLGGAEIEGSNPGSSGTTVQTVKAHFSYNCGQEGVAKTAEPLKIAADVKLLDMNGAAQPAAMSGARGKTIFEPAAGATLNFTEEELAQLVVDENGKYKPLMSGGAVCWDNRYYMSTLGATLGKASNGPGVAASFSETYKDDDGATKRYAERVELTGADGATVSLSAPASLGDAVGAAALRSADAYGCHFEWTGKWIVDVYTSAASTAATSVAGLSQIQADPATDPHLYLVDAGSSVSVTLGEYDLSIWPQFTAVRYPYKVAYELNGGSADSIAGNTAELCSGAGDDGVLRALSTVGGSAVADEDATTLVYDAPTREGYEFRGWYTTPDFELGSEATADKLTVVNATGSGATAIDASIYTNYGKSPYTYEDSQAGKTALTLYAKWGVATDTDLSKLTVRVLNDYTSYTGAAITPRVEFYDEGGAKVDMGYREDYTFDYGDADVVRDVGDYEVTVQALPKARAYGEASFTFHVASGRQVLSGATAHDVAFGSEPFALGITSNAAGASFSYRTSDPSVAAVSANGTVTAGAVGTADITVTSTASNYMTATMKVSVTVHDSALVIHGTQRYDKAFGDEPFKLDAACDTDGAVLSYATSDPAIAAVSDDGTVTVGGAGEATVTVTASAPGAGKASFAVVVHVADSDALTLTGTRSYELAYGSTLQLDAAASMAGAALAYKSSDESVARVGDDGTVRPTGTGPCSITVTATAAGHRPATMTVRLTVVEGTLSLTGSASAIVYAGRSVDVDVAPSTGAARLEFESSDTDVATVSSEGLVTGVSAGEATVTVTATAAHYSPASFKIAVTVKAASAAGDTIEADDDSGSAAGEYVVNADGGTVTLDKVDDTAAVQTVDTITVGGQTFAVTVISAGAFKGSAVVTVVLGDSVKSIGAGAFVGADKLQQVTVGRNVTSIGANAFSGCAKLKAATIGASVASIGASAFKGCTSLASVSVPAKTTSIGASAFSGCAALSKVALGGGVKTIGASAFSGCKALASISVPAKVTSLGKAAFSGCSKLKSVTIGKGVKTVGANVLKGTKATKVTLKTSKLTKKNVKNLVKGSKVKTVVLSGMSKKVEKATAKKYKKYLGKKYKVK